MQAIPEKYSKYKLDPIDEFFAMGRGLQKPQSPDAAAVDVPALVCNPLSDLSNEQSAYCSVGDGEMVRLKLPLR
jgi:hypothetical protein